MSHSYKKIFTPRRHGRDAARRKKYKKYANKIARRLVNTFPANKTSIHKKTFPSWIISENFIMFDYFYKRDGFDYRDFYGLKSK
jgi:hypothetical protein